jgi:hypothetical protein
MTLLIIIHLFTPPLAMNGYEIPCDEPSCGFRITEKPMPSMEHCEKFVARISRDKTALLYCINVGVG